MRGLAVGPLLVVLVGAAMASRVSSTRVLRWLHRFSVPVSEATMQVTASYLRQVSRCRAGGAVVGVAVAHVVPSFSANATAPEPLSNAWLMAVVGYLVGAAVGEQFAPRLPAPTGASRRRALVLPRRVGDYVPGGLVLFMWAPVITAVVVVVVGEVAPVHRGYTFSVWPLLVEVAGAAAFLVFVIAAQRRVVNRGQPAVSQTDLLRVDDALRAASLRVMTGAASALGLLVLADVVVSVGTATAVQWLRWTAAPVGLLVLPVAALVVWLAAARHWAWPPTTRAVNGIG